MRALGREPAHLLEVRRNGLAYPKSTARYHVMLRRLGLMRDDFALGNDATAALLDVVRETPYPAVRAVLGQRLATLSGADHALIDDWLRRIETNQEIPVL